MGFEGFDLSMGEPSTSALINALERDLWVDFLRAPVLDAVAEEGIETRRYGPIQATVVAALPEAPLLNLDEREWPRAAAAMMVQREVGAHLGFAAAEEPARGRGFHRALLARCIRDAIDAAPLFVAETTEPLGDRDGPSQGCCNLLRAGFSQASVRTTWRREVETPREARPFAL